MNDGVAFCPNCGFENEKAKSSTPINMPSIDIWKFIHIIGGVVVLVIAIFLVKGIINGRHCKYGSCENKVYKDGYCQSHYAKIVAEENLNDVISGKKDWKDAAKDTYDKSFTKEQKDEINNSINDIKNSLGNLFGN